jgi:hypothetical protein
MFNILFGKITANGQGIAEGGEKNVLKLNLAPQLAKPFFVC